MAKTRSALLVVAVMAALAGCSSNGVTVNRSSMASNYTGAFYVQSQAQNGTNSVLVRNSPVPPDDVIAALSDRYQGNQYRFAPGPNPVGWNGYTVVLSFGGPTLGGQNLCQNMSAPQLQPPPDRTEVVGAYCYGSRLITEAVGRSPAISGPQDPRFRQLIGDVVAELFTNEQRYPDHGGGSSGGVPAH